MAVLKRIRWEHLAQSLAQGLTQKAAGIKAGYSERSVDATVCKLAKRPDIKARIEDLRTSGNQVAATTVGITKAWVIEGLQRTIEEARADKQYAVVRGCLTDIGKELFHMFVERHEIDWLEQFKRAAQNPQDLSDEELERLSAALDGTGAKQKKEIEAGPVVDVEAQVMENVGGVEQQSGGGVAQKDELGW